ncbi:helix-turn-helix domain-containing protein [Cryptosporangium japonicum]|uniref:Helix-turn-helix domain-containing protein n=2 Tax=Cryptosporangium japonicum TaxID=80872 RepID=A0ABN0UYZ4_9ACTN
MSLVRELIDLPRETEWVEYKHNNSSHEQIGEYVSALANSAALDGRDRGYVLWGVEDKTRRLVGTSFRPHEEKVGNEHLANWLLRHLSPQVHFEFYEVEVDGLPIVLLIIGHAEVQPVAFKRVEYIRIGSYKKKLAEHPETARRLWKQFVLGSFEDGTATDRLTESEVLQLLDYPAYFDLMALPLPEDRGGIISTLSVEGFISRDDSGRLSITNLGGILFAKRLDDFPSLRRKAVRVIQYSSNSRVATVKEQLGVHGYAAGFAGLISYINGLLPSNEVVGQALRQTVKMYPELAIRELVANALIHQDFSITGAGPMVEIFDDRIEITNPGLPLIDPLRFIDSPPRSRNERLGTIMRRGGICEERGSGWDKIGLEIELHQLPAPLIEVDNDHTRVTLLSYRALKDMDRSDRVRAVYLHTCLRYVSRQKVTNTSIRERFGISQQNSAKASRLIKEAVEDGMIALRDPHAPLRLREYVPSWAASSTL